LGGENYLLGPNERGRSYSGVWSGIQKGDRCRGQETRTVRGGFLKPGRCGIKSGARGDGFEKSHAFFALERGKGAASLLSLEGITASFPVGPQLIKVA